MDSTTQCESNIENQLVTKMLTQEDCPENVLAIKDALDALEGRWKLLILLSLSEGRKRFKEIARQVYGITDKMLSKELKLLEANKLVKRTVYDTFPPTVEYAITDHGKSLEPLLNELYRWGVRHRKEVIGA